MIPDLPIDNIQTLDIYNPARAGGMDEPSPSDVNTDMQLLFLPNPEINEIGRFEIGSRNRLPRFNLIHHLARKFFPNRFAKHIGHIAAAIKTIRGFPSPFIRDAQKVMRRL